MSVLIKMKLQISSTWQWLTNLGTAYCKSELDKRRIALANQMNLVMICIFLIIIILSITVYRQFTDYKIHLAFAAAIANLVLSGKGFLQLSKLSLCILPLFLLLFYPIIWNNPKDEFFLWYAYAAISFSILPHLIFSFNKERLSYIISELYFLLLVIFSEYFLMLNVNKPLSILPILKENFIFFKTAQISIYIFINLAFIYNRVLHYKYEKKLSDNALIIHEQSDKLTASNEELRASSEELKETHKQLERYKNNLEKLVSLRTLELKESEEKFRSYFMNSIDGIFLTDEKGNYLEVNPATAIMTGYTSEELCSMNIAQLNVETEIMSAKERFSIVNTEGQVFETPFKRKDGSTGYWIISAVQLSDKRRIGFTKEITERKQTEKELNQTKILLEQTFNQCPVPMILVSMPGAIIRMANPASLEILGITDEPSYIGTSLFDFEASFIDFDKKGNICKFEDLPLVQTLQGKRTYNEEHKIVRKDGTERWELVNGVPIFDTQGELIAGYLILNDITELKNTEVALRESEEKFSKSFRNAPVMFGLNDSNGRFIDFNEEALRVAGYKRDEVINRTAVETGWISPENRARMIQELQKNGRIYGLEMEFNAKDGHKVIGLLNGEQITISGKPCVLTVTLDITERKKAEEAIRLSESKYRRLHEAIIDGFASVSMQGKILEFNEPFQKMLGYESEELLNLTYNAFTPEKWHEFEKEIVINEVIPNGFSKPYQKEYRKKDGTIFPIELRTYLLKNEADENEGMWAIIRDITEKKEAERKILHAIVDAEEKERNYFAREIHDGLGPLLSTIRLYLQWLAKPSLKASKTDLLAKADAVIEDALTSAREISHKLSPQVLINFGLTPAIKSFIDRVSDSTKASINFASNLEKRINNDVEITIYRVVNECINNSLKHANATNIDITLIHEQESINMIYTDNGIGFDVSKKTAQGKGLGLYNMKNRVETLGGTITIESKKKEGVRIELQIDMQNQITSK